MVNPAFNTLSLQPASITSPGVLGPATIDTLNTDWMFFQLGVGSTASVQVEASYDGITWDLVPAICLGAGAAPTLLNSTSGIYAVQTGPPLHRIRATAVSGTLTLRGGSTDVVNATPLLAGGPVTGTKPDGASVSTINAQLGTAPAAAGRNNTCNLLSIALTNPTASPVYLKIFNKAGAPVLATDIPVLVIPVNAGATAIQNMGQMGFRFSSGVAYAVTGAMADLDATPITAGCKLLISTI